MRAVRETPLVQPDRMHNEEMYSSLITSNLRNLASYSIVVGANMMMLVMNLVAI